MEAVLKQTMASELTAMKSRLKLSPDQEGQIRTHLEQQRSALNELLGKMFAGKMTHEEIANVQKLMVARATQITSLLTPEQQTAHAELQTEERHNNARRSANSEVALMQSAFGLSQEQQYKLVRSLYTEAGPQDSVAKAFDPRKMMAQKLEALRGVLTDEEFAGYKEMQAQQMEMIRAFLPKNGDGAR